MAHDDTAVLNERFTGDPLSESLRLATHIISTYVKPDLAHPENGLHSGRQLDDDITTATFNFVTMLATDVSSGKLKLPCWPGVVVQIKHALQYEDCSEERLIRLVGSEPVLVAELLRSANSERYADRKRASDLRTAVKRLGFKKARSVAISLAAAQTGNGQVLHRLKPYLAELWQHSVQVAAIADILAKQFTRINPEEAHLAGLLHDIGKLYVLTHAQNEPVLCDSKGTLQEIVDAWHTSIGVAILESWGFCEHIVAAVRDHEICDLEGIRPPNLADVVSVANLLANQQNAEPVNHVDLNKVPACRRLKLHAGISTEVMRASDVEIQGLHQVLGIQPKIQ